MTLKGFFQGLGSKIRDTGQSLGQKIKAGVGFGKKVIGKVLGGVSKAAQVITKATELDHLFKAIGSGVRTLGKVTYDALPKKLQGPIAKLYTLSPAKKIVDTFLLTTDMLSGKRPISEADLDMILPGYAALKNEISLTTDVLVGDREAAKRHLAIQARIMAANLISANADALKGGGREL